MKTSLTELFDRIRDAIDACGPAINRHDQAVLAITMCIGDGVNTMPDIIRVLVTYGFDGGHIANMLDDRRGPFRNSEHWRVDANGRHHLVDD